MFNSVIIVSELSIYLYIYINEHIQGLLMRAQNVSHSLMNEATGIAVYNVHVIIELCNVQVSVL